MMKVALIISICGASRKELRSLQVSDIIKSSDWLIIMLFDIKTNNERIFSIATEGEVVNSLEYTANLVFRMLYEIYNY